MQMWAIILANEFPQVGVAVKTRVVAGATILSAVVYQTVAAGASAQTSLNPLAKASSSQAGPSIEFLRPIKNEGFFDYPIFIQVGVERFKLVPPTSIQRTPSLVSDTLTTRLMTFLYFPLTKHKSCLQKSWLRIHSGGQTRLESRTGR